MKVKIEKMKTGSRVIFEIENKADAIDFHDKVVIKMGMESCSFIGDCFDLACGLRFDNEYVLTFPISPEPPSGPLI
jgi:hypothetical protein